MQPWFWVGLLFFGRVCRNLTDQWFMFFDVSHIMHVGCHRARAVDG